ncbi:hypothetical protein [Simplicispira suum]|uniref:DUF4340 domain-containing protein n=1 Tax=Simplicispira suum TaxID=2109915 RepID=A0A2S0N1E5_9BURK|nr:hypothetical protein [Simplicispira suum]AVO41974.1 hypothetical protein C6571_12380 [Simplicispira suum]
MGHTATIKVWLSGLLLLAAAAAANADPAERFINAKGFRAVDVEALEGSRYYTAARFPKMGASAFRPDADLPAPVRALLLMESHEGALPHARYLVNYQPTTKAASPDDRLDFVDITRFNLGPAVHADLVDSVPAEHLADVKVFGVGPHVRWRFAMSPMRGMTAGLDAASRKLVTSKEAAAMECLGLPCANLESAEGPKGRWEPQKLVTPAPSYRRSTPQGPVPSSVVEQLLTLMGEDAQRPTPFAGNAKRLVFVVSAHAGGQEQQTTGLARNALVFDDAVGTYWLRFHQVGDMAAEVHALSQKRR